MQPSHWPALPQVLERRGAASENGEADSSPKASSSTAAAASASGAAHRSKSTSNLPASHPVQQAAAQRHGGGGGGLAAAAQVGEAPAVACVALHRESCLVLFVLHEQLVWRGDDWSVGVGNGLPQRLLHEALYTPQLHSRRLAAAASHWHCGGTTLVEPLPHLLCRRDSDRRHSEASLSLLCTELSPLCTKPFCMAAFPACRCH